MSASTPAIYFFDVHGDRTHLYIGFDGSKRLSDHERNGKTFVAGMPGSKNFEDRLHQYFRDVRKLGCSHFPKSRSIYCHDDVWAYVEWLLSRGYAVSDEASIEHIQPALWDLIDPSLPRTIYAPDGTPVLFSSEPPSRPDRLARAAALAKHLSQTDEWYTPAYIVDAARNVMGSIDTDPASCPTANQSVRATRYYSHRVNGLHPDHPWNGNIWLNPPYGALAQKFLERLVAEIKAGVASQAIILLSSNAASAHWMEPLYETSVAMAFTRGRIQFVAGNGQKLGQQAGGGSVFGYWGHRPDVFASIFSELRPTLGQGPSGCRLVHKYSSMQPREACNA